MSQSIEAVEKTFVAGSADLNTKQYYAVKQHTDGSIILAAAATDKIFGILQNKPLATEAAIVRWASTSKAKAGGTISVGAWVTATTDGTVIATTTAGDIVIGMYLGTAAAASGDVIEILMTKFAL